jgi:hypothetical protein
MSIVPPHSPRILSDLPHAHPPDAGYSILDTRFSIRPPTRAEISNFGFRISDFGFPPTHPLTNHLDNRSFSCIEHRASSIEHRASSIEHRASSIEYPRRLTIYKLAICQQNRPMNDSQSRCQLLRGASIVPVGTNDGRRTSVNRYGERW